MSLSNSILNTKKMNTEQQYTQIINYCREIFQKKNRDYGTSWRIYRASALTDKIYIKAKRIRSIQENGTQKVADDLNSEFLAIVNYCIMALIQLENIISDENSTENQAENFDIILQKYDFYVAQTQELMQNKNHDYGEAWRDMRMSSMTDEILVKLLRIKQIEDNQGKTIASEGIAANYQDILNYAVFCLILADFAG